MRPRVRQLACLLFLLASLSAAAGANSRSNSSEFAPRYVAVLQELHARSLRLEAFSACDESASHVRSTALAVDEHAAIAQPWTMLPPAQHTASITAHTALAV